MNEPTKPSGTFSDTAGKYLPLPDTEQIGGTHYRDFAIQPADFITRNSLSFLRGCVIKRMCRAGKKGNHDTALEDLRKAIHEIKLIALYEYGETDL